MQESRQSRRNKVHSEREHFSWRQSTGREGGSLRSSFTHALGVFNRGHYHECPLNRRGDDLERTFPAGLAFVVVPRGRLADHSPEAALARELPARGSAQRWSSRDNIRWAAHARLMSAATSQGRPHIASFAMTLAVLLAFLATHFAVADRKRRDATGGERVTARAGRRGRRRHRER